MLGALPGGDEIRTKLWPLAALFLSVLATPALAQSPERFAAAKKLLDVAPKIRTRLYFTYAA